ncbi:MAG: hypothetical protein RJA41_731 [Actinomycetota bacterium]|jgi:hypothetical protein
MGTLVEKFKVFREECFTSTIPILTPRVAGTAMMVSPKTIAAAIVAKLTGEPEHDSECNCDLCHYRELKKQNQCEVADQRVKISNFVSTIFPNRKSDNDELSEEEVVYYLRYLSENFPELVFYYEDREHNLYLYNAIRDVHRSKIDMYIFELIERHKRFTFLTNDEFDEVISRHVTNNDGLMDYWETIFELAALRKEREMEGFEAALCLDFP